MAVNAGADIVLVGWPDDWRDARRVVEALKEAVSKGAIPMSRVDESVQRCFRRKRTRYPSISVCDEKKAKELVGSEG